LILFQNHGSPWGARGWSQFYFIKLLWDCEAIPTARGAQGIAAEILLAFSQKDWSEKPGLRRFTPQMRQNSESK
jgi:hypothetical protein